MSFMQCDRSSSVSAMFCSTEMSPVERGEGGSICHLVLPWGNTVLPLVSRI